MDEDIEGGLHVSIEDIREENLIDTKVLGRSLPLLQEYKYDHMICNAGEDENTSQNNDNIGDVVERDSDEARDESVTALDICKK